MWSYKRDVKYCETDRMGVIHHSNYLRILEEARIIAVANAYDAMSSDRIYRTRLSQQEIIEELKNGMGTQFDPKFAEIMLAIVEEDQEYKMRG